MRNLFLIIFILYSGLAFSQRVEYNDEITVKPNEGLMIETKSPAELEIENISDEPIIMKSFLKIPTSILANSSFAYFLPKKGIIYLYNENSNEIKIKINAKTKKKLIIENLKTFKINENKLSHYRRT